MGTYKLYDTWYLVSKEELLDTSPPVNLATLQFRPPCKMLKVINARLHVSQFPVNAT